MSASVTNGVLCRWQGYSPVLLAAAHGKLKNIQALLPVFHGSLEEQTPDGSSVLHLLMGRQDCSLFLTPSVLDSFKDDEQVCPRSSWQCPCWHAAAQHPV